MKKDYKKIVNQLTSRDVYSVDTRGQPTTVDMYYNHIGKILSISNKLEHLSSVGFYRAGQLLNKAKRELKGDFGKLKKQLADKGLHQKQQERFMKIARNKKINLLYNQLPPEWTFWEKISTIIENDEKNNTNNFKMIEKMITPTVKWRDVESVLGKNKRIGETTTSINQPDNRLEIFGLEVNKTLSKKDKNNLKQLHSDLRKLSAKYKFISLKKKNYFDEVNKFLSKKIVVDDTAKLDVKFSKSYSTKKKISI